MNPPNDSNKAPPPPAYHPPSQEPSPQVSQQRPPLTATQMGEQYRSECLQTTYCILFRSDTLYSLIVYARCAQGLHDPSLKFGVCGIILAVVRLRRLVQSQLLDSTNLCFQLDLFPRRFNLPVVSLIRFFTIPYSNLRQLGYRQSVHSMWSQVMKFSHSQN